MRALLEAVQAKLRRAGLIEAPAPGRFRITARGREVLDDNPDGVDDTVLMQLPEFRPVNGHSAIAPAGPRAPAAAQRAPDTEYHSGFEAFLAGVGLADNPHPTDVRAYLDWENGWSQARDERLRQHVRPNRSVGSRAQQALVEEAAEPAIGEGRVAPVTLELDLAGLGAGQRQHRLAAGGPTTRAGDRSRR